MVKLDEINVQIVDLLRRDGRMSIAAIASVLGISRSNAYQRYEWLIDNGVITGFTAFVNFDTTGLDVAAWIFVKVRQERWEEFHAALANLPELEYFTMTTGQHDGMMLVRAADIGSIHVLVASTLAGWPSVRSTETVIILDEQWHRANIAASLENSRLAAEERERSAGMARYIRASSESR